MLLRSPPSAAAVALPTGCGTPSGSVFLMGAGPFIMLDAAPMHTFRQQTRSLNSVNSEHSLHGVVLKVPDSNGLAPQVSAMTLRAHDVIVTLEGVVSRLAIPPLSLECESRTAVWCVATGEGMPRPCTPPEA